MGEMSVLPDCRFLLIDDHAMFRTGLKMVIAAAMPRTQVLEAACMDEAWTALDEQVDLVLLDIKLQGLNGMDGLVLLRHKHPGVPVLVLSSQDDPQTVRSALGLGAAGFLSKAESADKMVQSIGHVLGGQREPVCAPGAQDLRKTRLTPRQCEVLDLLHQGKSNKLIARQLGLSDNTVRRHVQDILAHFEVVSRTEAVFEARRLGLIG